MNEESVASDGHAVTSGGASSTLDVEMTELLGHLDSIGDLDVQERPALLEQANASLAKALVDLEDV